jgi:hypothetical protein
VTWRGVAWRGVAWRARLAQSSRLSTSPAVAQGKPRSYFDALVQKQLRQLRVKYEALFKHCAGAGGGAGEGATVAWDGGVTR